MKTATVRELKAKLSRYLKASESEDILITSHGKPKAVLRALSEDNLEDYIIANSPTIKKKIENAYKDYLKHGGVSLDKIVKELEQKG